jgi:[acyl-carrier-protein] S-malonyltransferase
LGKIAFVFPGQGSQSVGMGKDAYEQLDAARQVFDRADAALGFPLTKLAFEGPEEDLRQTANTQPALLATSIALLEVYKMQGVKPDYVAGHSLGEYSALIAAGVLEFEEAIRLVRARGQFMEQAVPGGQGAMAAVMGAEREPLAALCLEVSATVGRVELANINCPGQIVVSGSAEGVAAIARRGKEAGAKRVIPLEVSGPFHSSLMQPAADRLAGVLAEADFRDAAVPVVANVTAQPVTAGTELRQLLVQQVVSPVLWEDTVRCLIGQGVDTFVEIGSGTVLAGLIRKIDKSVQVVSINTAAAARETTERRPTTMPMWDLTGKTALVTGASRGIGRAIAVALAEAGADVAVNYAGSEAAAAETVKAIEALGRKAMMVKANVGKPAEFEHMVAGVLGTFGKLDILVNNAGITRDNLIMRMKEEEFDAVIETNLKGVFNGIKAVTRSMMKQRSGRIINISSVVGTLGNAGQANYVAAKAGVIGLTKSAARELASRNITVNAVAPGFIGTDMTDKLPADMKEKLENEIPLGRIGRPEEIASCVLYLASDAASYMTGQTIHVDGGMYM